MKNQKWNRVLSIVLSALCLVLLSACDSSKSKKAIVDNALSVAEKYHNSWVDKDPDVLTSLLSEDVIGFDASMANWSYNKKSSDDMARDPDFWTGFKVYKGTIFVSQDGQFAAILTIMDFYQGTTSQLPNAHIIAIKDDQIYFAYDYYGGGMSDVGFLPKIESSTVEIGSSEAEDLVQQATELVKKWQGAFNERDTETYLSCYAEDVHYIDLANPEWRVMTKDELAKDIDLRFPRSTFTSKLEASKFSPFPDGFFISADGHYAAIQGTYHDLGVSEKPMFTFLMIENGLIVSQYNYMEVDLDHLIE